MQPLFVHNRLLLSVLVASILIWKVMEAGVDIRTLKRLRAGAQRQDKGSHVVLLCLIVFGLLLGVRLAFEVPATAITNAPNILFWLGILLMYTGIALRLYAITVLGVFFTTTVAVAPKQTVIEAGPYRFIRHPSYTGFLLNIARIWAQLDELVESARHHGMCADWFQLPYPGGRACPQGAAGPTVSGVHAAHKTTHPLCPVTKDQFPSLSAHPLLFAGAFA